MKRSSCPSCGASQLISISYSHFLKEAEMVGDTDSKTVIP